MLKRILIIGLILGLVAVLIACVGGPSFFFNHSSADSLPDLSALSYDELVQLRDRIDLAMWNSQEWQEVTVPPGVYEIGKDIPAGHWSVRPAKGCGPDYIVYASAPKDQGHDVDLFAGFHIMECICDPSAQYYSEEYKTTTDIDMESGFFVRLDCTMIFTPYSGKPDLGFK